LSILLIYLLGRQLFNQEVGLLAALIASLNSYFLWLSRIGLQEIIVIFFSLLTLYLLTKAKAKSVYFLFWGISLGLAILTKYTAFILLPLSLVYLWLFKPVSFKSKNFYLGLILSLLLFSPVIYYNLQMKASVGHFDLQLSSLLDQETPEWLVLPGKNIGSLTERLKNFYPNLWQNSSPPFFVIYLLALLVFLANLFKKIKSQENFKNEVFLLIILIFYHLLILKIGPSQRFLGLLIPFLILLTAVSLQLIFGLKKIYRYPLYFLLAGYLIYEGFFSLQTNLVAMPWKNSPFVF